MVHNDLISVKAVYAITHMIYILDVQLNAFLTKKCVIFYQRVDHKNGKKISIY
jgi:hypothetical protein